MVMSRDAESWFNEYSESHQNPLNKAIHFVAVPSIYGSVIGMLWSLPGYIWLALAILAAHIFYFRLSLSIATGMLLVTGLIWWGIEYLDQSGWVIWQLSLLVFVVMWILQFIGHALEGKRPSFFRDIQFLLVGPAWVLGFIYRKLGVRY